VDPLLTVSSPPHVTAATGIDALCHAIEAYISRRFHPFSDTLALSATKLILEHIETAYQDGKDIEARYHMSLAAAKAGLAFSNASVCFVHGMSRPIGALFHVPHGISNAMLLPAVLECSLDACTKRLAEVSQFAGISLEEQADYEAANQLVEHIKKLCLSLNITNLKKWGIKQEEFLPLLEKMASDALASGSPGNNPKIPSKEEIINLYKTCYEYQFC
jgi:alcohol dehydrogenase class IV